MSTLKVNEVRHLSNSGTANLALESNGTTNLQATSTLGLTTNGTLTVSNVATFNGNVQIGSDSSDTMVLTSKVSGFNNFSGFTGEIRMYAGNAAGDDPPDGWLYCNGDTVSSTSANGGTHYNLDGKGNDYQPLFNLLKASSDWGNSSSASWGTNTIKTPDFRSRAPVGNHTGAATTITAGLTSRTLSDTVGAETHALTIAELAVHTHVMTNYSSLTGTTISTMTADQATHRHTGTTNSTTPSPTGGPNTASTGNQSASHTHTVTQGYADGSEENHGLGPAWGGQGTFNSSQHVNNQSASHTHSMQSNTHTSAAHTHPFTTGYFDPAITVSGGALTDPQHSHTSTAANTGSGTAHTILSPIIAVNYIIKV